MPTNHANGSATAASSRISAADPRTDQRVVAALEHYLELGATGRAPELENFLAQYPEIADELRDCLAGLELVRQAAPDVADSTAQFALGLAPFSEPLGDFRILREIGRGGMGIVYEAEQLSLGRRVALKVLPFAGVLDERQLQRFKHEASAAAMLKHPHIVSIYSIGCERGVHFYAMELIDGPTLAELIEARKSQQPQERSQKPESGIQAEKPTASVQNPDVEDETSQPKTENRKLKTPHSSLRTPHSALPPDTSPVLQAALSTVNSISEKERFRRIAELGIQAAEALEHAHERGIVHRDIKPSNLMIDADGQLWITDFGLAHIEANPNLTLTGDLVGTLRYMSAEQAAGRPAMVDHRTDIYSLGATMYELATDRPVVQAQDRAAILREIAEKDPTSPRKYTPSMPTDLETILLKCLAKEPSARYDSAQALAEDLRRFLECKPVRAKRPGFWDRVGKWTRRRRTALTSMGATLLMALAATTVLQWRAYQSEKAHAAASQRQADRANANLALARKAVDTFYLEYVGKELANNAVLTAKQQDILEKALTFYEQAAQQNEMEPGQLPEAVKAYAFVARARFNLKDYEGARKAAESALAIHDSLLPVEAQNVSVVENRFTSLLLLGSVHAMQDRPLEAEEVLQESLHLTRDPNSGFSGLATAQDIAQRIQVTLGLVYGSAGRNEEACQAYEAAVGSFAALVERNPNSAELLTSYGDLLHSLGRTNACLGHFDQAIQRFDDAENMLNRAHALVPNDGMTLYTLEWVRFDRAKAYEENGDAHAGLQSLRQAAETVDDVAYSGPADFDHYELRVHLLLQCLQLQLQLQDSADWDVLSAKLQRALGRMTEKFADLSAARFCVAEAHFDLGSALLADGQNAMAEKELQMAELHFAKLSSDVPDNEAYRCGLEQARENLSNAHKQEGVR